MIRALAVALPLLIWAQPSALAADIPAPSSAQPSAQSSPPWSARGYQYSVGYEGTTSGTMIGANAITLGKWQTQRYGYELLVGFTKSSDSVSEQQQTVTQPYSTTANQNVSTVYNGARNPYVFTLGILPKLKAYQNSWFMVYGGLLFALSYSTGVSYNTGSATILTPNPALPENQTVTESGYGTIQTAGVLSTVVGPRIGSEIYIHALPNVAIGFAAGLITTLTGDSTTTTSVQSETYSVVNGVAQPPTGTPSSTTTVVRGRPGVSGATVALAGQAFDLFGTFTIRYVW